MNTNKKFAYYALEDFEGNPQQAGILLYDKDEDIPMIDCENPGVLVEIKFTGDLDNPFDRAVFNKCLNSFGLYEEELDDDAHGVLCQSGCDIPVEYSRDDAVLEALGVATEDNIFTKIGDAAKAAGQKIGGAIKAKQTAGSISKSQKQYSDVDRLFRQDEDHLKRAITSTKEVESLIEPIIVGRYYADTVSSGDTDVKIFVCFTEEGKKLTQRNAKEVSTGVTDDEKAILVNHDESNSEAAQTYKTTYTKVVQTILQNIKNAVRGKPIAGYTTDAEAAQKFKESLSPSDTTGIAVELKKLDKDKKYEELSKLWKDKLPSERDAMLDQLLAGAEGKITPPIKSLLLSLKQPPFGKLSWDIVKYHIAGSSTKPLNETTFKTILQKAALQDIFVDNGLKGMDFSSEAQVATILQAYQLDPRDAKGSPLWDLHNGDKKVWLSPKDMAPKYEEYKNSLAKKRRTNPTGKPKQTTSNTPEKPSAANAQDVVNSFLDLVAAGKANLTTDQKAELIKRLYGGK